MSQGSTSVEERIRQRFAETGTPATIPLQQRRVFRATLFEHGVNVDNLGNLPFLPWAAFDAAVSAVIRGGGRAPRGDAMNSRLGESGLSLESIEGFVASHVYGKQQGDMVFRRISPIAAILVWSGICRIRPRELLLSVTEVKRAAYEPRHCTSGQPLIANVMRPDRRPKPMYLEEITPRYIREVLDRHHEDGGNAINASLSKLFSSLNDEENANEVHIKVAALNQIYATSIQYLTPVVKVIVSEVGNSHSKYDLEGYADIVDNISQVAWTSPTTGNPHSRRNLSFASKYIHFLSNKLLPIYDSYIWIVMTGYMLNKPGGWVRFTPPKSYKEFYSKFLTFKTAYALSEYSNYDIDKFLWQYGKSEINRIIREESVSLEKAKSILKKRITNRC